jgi:hypothetical protein
LNPVFLRINKGLIAYVDFKECGITVSYVMDIKEEGMFFLEKNIFNKGEIFGKIHVVET